MTTVEQLDLLTKIRARLSQAFARRLRGVVLYGSLARGEEHSQSDVDVLVLLDEVRLWRDTHTALLALYPLSDELGRYISPKVVEATRYETSRHPLLERARAEGIRL